MNRIGLVAVLLLTLASCGGTSGSTAQAVVDDFAAAGLPVPNARDNSHNCADLGCEQLITTEAVSVYSFDDLDAAQHMAEVYGEGAHREQGIVLQYAGARTPQELQAAYEARLKEFLAGASPASAPPSASALTALGDKKAPFDSTTAVDVIEAAKAARLPIQGATEEDPALCANYDGCRSAARAGLVKVVVFETAVAAQEYRETPDGAAVEDIGGRRYWLLVDYRQLDPEERSAWRNVQRTVIP